MISPPGRRPRTILYFIIPVVLSSILLLNPMVATTQPADPAISATAPPSPTEGEYVSAPDLARTLRTIDPNARLDWDGEVFRIQAGGQFFSLYLKGPSSREIIINGETKQLPTSLLYRESEREFFIPSLAVELIGQALEKTRSTPIPAPTLTPSTLDQRTTPTSGPDPAGLPIPTPVVLAFPTPPPIRATPALPVPTLNQTAATEGLAPTPITIVSDANRNRGATLPAAIRSNSIPTLLADRNQLRQLEQPRLSSRELINRVQLDGIRHVILDPDDAGLVGSPAPTKGQQMADATLEITRHIRNRLLSRDIKVTLLRETSERVSPSSRIQKLMVTPADLLLTLSVSETESPEVSGLRAFYPSDVVDATMAAPLDRSPEETVPGHQVYRLFQARSQTIAGALLQAVRPTTPQLASSGGGSAPAPLYLARRAPMPAVNLVLGYVSNPGDFARLSTPALQQEMGYAVADAIVELAGMKVSGPENTNRAAAPRLPTAQETGP
jgi:N-acetylmuramoyl-L-alanine amidase